MKIFVTLLMGLFFVGSAFAQTAAPVSKGKQLFTEKKCVSCHTIESEGIAKKSPTAKMNGPDLSAAGTDAKPGFIAKFLAKETDLHGKKHMSTLKGTDDETKTLVAYLEGLKGKKEVKEMKEVKDAKAKK